MKKIFLIIGIVLTTFYAHSQTNWEAPEEAAKMVNPLKGNTEDILKKGEKEYKTLCAGCHGTTGKGDVPAMQSLNPKPTDFTTAEFQSQTDGEIFWKISEGRGMMASYKNMLSEEERWALVVYLRSFKKGVTTKTDTEKKKSKKKVARKEGQESFLFTVSINSKTTHIMQPEGFGLIIQHRFGKTSFDKSFITDFMGFDLGANIRFAFEIPVNDKLQFEIGRTRYGKYYDAGGKYLFVKQTKDNSIPVSIALYENVAVYTDVAPQFSDFATFENGSKFEYMWYHRFYYDSQIMFSRKFSRTFSAQVTGEFIWRNLTPYSENKEEKSYIIAVPVSLRIKTGLISSICLEVMPNTHKDTFPVSLAYEIESSGNHVFQITVTNTDRIMPQNIFTNPTVNYFDGEFMLGFNLVRYF